MLPEISPNLTWHLGLSLIIGVIFALLFISAIFFVILVTYLDQWGIYYPSLGKWIKAKKFAALEKARKDKKRQRKMGRKDG